MIKLHEFGDGLEFVFVVSNETFTSTSHIKRKFYTNKSLYSATSCKNETEVTQFYCLPINVCTVQKTLLKVPKLALHNALEMPKKLPFPHSFPPCFQLLSSFIHCVQQFSSCYIRPF